MVCAASGSVSAASKALTFLRTAGEASLRDQGNNLVAFVAPRRGRGCRRPVTPRMSAFAGQADDAELAMAGSPFARRVTRIGIQSPSCSSTSALSRARSRPAIKVLETAARQRSARAGAS